MILGVHGFPQVEWDGVKGIPNPQYPGYADHTSILFLPWHRPYLAAYEQILQQNAIQIANEYPPNLSQQYKDAANIFRIPYWDWANSATMPESITTPNITITGPNGQGSIKNPLASYNFHPIPSAAEFPTAFKVCPSPVLFT